MSKLANVALGAAAILALLGDSEQAFAHAELNSEIPAANSVVSSVPTNVTLKFSDVIELKFSGVTIWGPGKLLVALGPATLARNDSTTLVVEIQDPLTPGKYEVAWHNLSADRHKLKGPYAFTVK